MNRAAGPSLEATFRSSYGRLVAALSLGAGQQAAEDAVAEAFIRAGVRWWRVRRYDDPGAWIRRVAINILANDSRNSSRRRSAESRARPPICVGGPHESRLDLEDALADLPLRQRLYIVLYYVEQMRVREIAEATGVAEGTVKSTLHDARRSLFERLGEDYAT